MAEHAIAYWFLPTEPARAFFSQTIRDLALKFGAPEFEPHLTIATVPIDSRSPNGVLGQIGSQRLTLTIEEIRYSDKFTKSVFVQFKTSDTLRELANAIERASGGQPTSTIDPHLSLLYHDLPPDEKCDIAGRIRIPFAAVCFDTICAMQCASPTTSAADLRGWTMVATQNSTMR